MKCPVCSRPVAMARANCIYCRAPLSSEILDAASQAAQRVLETKSLASLEGAALGLDEKRPPRLYVVVETATVEANVIAEACSVSLWEARQWQAASPYRLIRITAERDDGPLVGSLRAKGLNPLLVPEATVARARNPVFLETIDLSPEPVQCTLREDPEGPPDRRELIERELALVVSAPIRRERVKDPSGRHPKGSRLEDAWLVHLHFRQDLRPWEIDPRRTSFQGPGLASAHMRTLDLVRRLSTQIPLDEGFKHVVPALAPGVEPTDSLQGLVEPKAKRPQEPKALILDNVAQFREYSAWRAAIERVLVVAPNPPGRKQH